jgi:hypothetical protein
MWIIQGIVAGILAGVIMGAISTVGHRLGVIKSNLVLVDGSFALRMLRRQDGKPGAYWLGTLVHLGTSMTFGIVYVILAQLGDFDVRLVPAIVIYVLLLWIIMLFTALPIAGQGTMGRKIGQFVWAEQLVLHIVFGISLWWILAW